MLYICKCFWNQRLIIVELAFKASEEECKLPGCDCLQSRNVVFVCRKVDQRIMLEASAADFDVGGCVEEREDGLRDLEALW